MNNTKKHLMHMNMNSFKKHPLFLPIHSLFSSVLFTSSADKNYICRNTAHVLQNKYFIICIQMQFLHF